MNKEYQQFLKSTIGQGTESRKICLDQFGPPAYANEKGQLTKLNEDFWGAHYAQQRARIIYEPKEKKFYDYEPAMGIFVPKSAKAIRVELSALVREAAQKWDGWAGLDRLHAERNLNPAISFLAGHVEETNFFNLADNLVHLGNCTLRFNSEGGGYTREEFSREHRSRNRSPINYDPDADCPEFKKSILGHLSKEDRLLLQKYAGQCLLGRNLTQRFVILDGIGSASKTTFVKIIAGVIGPENVYELRTKQLGERFEIGRMIGRTLLTGSDVQSYFLSENGAHRIKSIVGGDLLEAELKCSNERFTVHGSFNLLITSNTRLRLPLHGDRSAWQRRLTIVRYDQPFSGQRMFEIEKHLLETEASGILNWCLKGLEMLFVDYAQAGDIILSEVQKKRVEDLLSESESLSLFVRDCVVPDCPARGNNGDEPHRPSLTVDEIIDGYLDFCTDKGWTPAPIAEVEKQLPDLMTHHFGLRKSHDILREGKARRGFWNVSLLQ
jgi:phage/plasmid-associated DNA primase